MLSGKNYISQTQGNLQTSAANVFSLSSQKNRSRVLVAENDADKRLELRELLDLYGVCILEAENGEEAIDLIVRGCPDLILINTELPMLDGYTVARLIRNIRSFDNVPIIFLSAQTERVFRKRAFDAGGDGFHIEPLDLDRLDNILENFLFHASDYA